MDCARVDSDGIPYRTKVPGSTLDYRADFAPLTNGEPGAETDWLEAGETITGAVVTVPAGLTQVGAESIVDNATGVLFFVSGGTAGGEYDIPIEVTTSGARVEVKTVRIKVLAAK